MTEPVCFIEVRGDDNRLLFKFDPVRNLIQIKTRNGRLQTVDLTQIEQRQTGIEKVAGNGRIEKLRRI